MHHVQHMLCLLLLRCILSNLKHRTSQHGIGEVSCALAHCMVAWSVQAMCPSTRTCTSACLHHAVVSCDEKLLIHTDATTASAPDWCPEADEGLC